MAAKVLECDLVVIGGGGAGLIAAVKASDDSGKKVIVLEKAKNCGGSTYFAGGPGVGERPGGAGIPTADQGGGKAGPRGGQGGPGGAQGDPGGGQGGPGGPGGPGGGGNDGGAQKLQSAFTAWFTTKVGAENFEKGARMERFKELPDPSIGPGRGGTFTIEKMLEFCKKQGIQVLTETPAKKFLTSSPGKVTGVIAESKDGEIQINCKACIVACGGFGRNYEMLKKHWPESYNNKEIFYLCPPGITGDGIIMAEAIGAQIDQTKWDQGAAGGSFAPVPLHHPYSWSLQMVMTDGRLLWINLKGERWNFAKESLASQPNATVYAVADSDLLETIGKGLLAGSGPSANPDSSEAKAIKKWKEDLEYECAIDEEGASGNHAKKANTLVELALKMRVDPEVFVKTIEEYNKAVAAGAVKASSPIDQGFSVKSDKAGAVLKPPFYAIWGHRFSQCTKGLNGIAVNNDFQILNPKGQPMPGLWAAGDTCTIYGGLVLQGFGQKKREQSKASDGNILHTTPSPCGGSSAAMISGHVAGTHAAEYLKKL